MVRDDPRHFRERAIFLQACIFEQQESKQLRLKILSLGQSNATVEEKDLPNCGSINGKVQQVVGVIATACACG